MTNNQRRLGQNQQKIPDGLVLRAIIPYTCRNDHFFLCLVASYILKIFSRTISGHRCPGHATLQNHTFTNENQHSDFSQKVGQ